MGIFKRILYFLLIIVAFGLLLPLLLRSEYKISASKIVWADMDMIYHQVVDLRNWNNWNAWHFMDSQAWQAELSSRTWESPHAGLGKGRMDVVSARSNSQVVVKMDFEDRPLVLTPRYDFEPDSGGIRITVTYEGKIPFFSRYLQLRYDLKSDLESKVVESLERLKIYSDTIYQRLHHYNYTPKFESPIYRQPCLVKRIVCTADLAMDSLRHHYNAFQAFADSNDFVVSKNLPVCINRDRKDPMQFDLYMGTLLDTSTNIEGLKSRMPAKSEIYWIEDCNAVIAKHSGNYFSFNTPHTCLNSWIHLMRMRRKGMSWELYDKIPDPGVESIGHATVYYPVY